MSAKDDTVTVYILVCSVCCGHAVAINDTRITDHRCGGSWRVIRTETVKREDIEEALK